MPCLDEVKYVFSQSETPDSVAPFGVSCQQDSLVTHKTQDRKECLADNVFITLHHHYAVSTAR
jgi:hypothetical protein